MRVSVGIDVAKQIHWATAMCPQGKLLLSRAVKNDPHELAVLVSELRSLGDELIVGLDLLGGVAALTQATLAAHQIRVVHVPGIVMNRARTATVGGESKSDPRDARGIADQVRFRSDLRTITPRDEVSEEIRLLVSRRTDLVQEQTRRLVRMRDLLCSINPGLERLMDVTTKGHLTLLTFFVTAGELRAVGEAGLREKLEGAVRLAPLKGLVEAVLASAASHQVRVPGEGVAAELVRELAREALGTRARVLEIEKRLDMLLAQHEDAPIIRTLPGMGTVLTAELIAEVGSVLRFDSPDSLASAAGLAPVLRQSGKMRFTRRAFGGDKGLKRVFYQSAFASLRSPESLAFYQRKRVEGKRHQQAVIALARRRINVLYAMVKHRKPYQPDHRPPPT